MAVDEEPNLLKSAFGLAVSGGKAEKEEGG